MKKLFAILLFLTSCASNTNNNVKYEIISRDLKAEQRHLNLEVTLLDLNRTPLSNIDVEVSSQNDNDQDITDEYGIADITLTIKENESIDIRFHSNTKNIDWTKTIEKVPTGHNDVNYVFVMQAKGNIELREVSY